MIASNVTRATLERAAKEIGVDADIALLNKRGTRFNVKLNAPTPQVNYRKQNPITGRKIHSLCWHGFRDYFRAVYRVEPDAVFSTMFDTWRGAADFEARHRASGERNIGSLMYPYTLLDACACSQEGGS